jgi:hypothetical protein
VFLRANPEAQNPAAGQRVVESLRCMDPEAPGRKPGKGRRKDRCGILKDQAIRSLTEAQVR